MLKHRQLYFANNHSLMSEQSLAQSHGRLGDVYRRLGQFDLASEYLTKCVAARRKWHQLAPKNLEPMEELAGALGTLSSLFEATGNFDEMYKTNNESLAILTRIALNKSDFPTAANLAIQLKKMGRQRLVSGADVGG